MHGNRRKPKNKPLYASYRCGSKGQKRDCDNKEIRKEYLEEFVLSELEKNILNEKAIPVLVKKINQHMENQAKGDKAQTETIDRELADIGKQIGNIAKAITQGFASEELKVKMEELSDRKASLESKLKEKEVRSHGFQVTVDQIRKLFSMFRGFVKDRNIPECKKFINNYVDKVIVYKDRVEVIFSVAFSVLKEQEAYKIRSALRKSTLFKRYWHIA